MKGDRCCKSCKSATHGVCRLRHECWCHAQQDAEDRLHDDGRTGHADPTGNTAVNNLMRAQKRRFPEPGRRRY